MRCPDCETLNREQAHFCKRCGFYLGSECPVCGNTLPALPSFCDQCGAHLVGESKITRFILSRPPEPPSTGERGSESELVDRLARSPRVVPVTKESANRADSPLPSMQAAIERFLPRTLAKKLEAARASGTMQGERRIVTMLFCDVKGSTAAAEQLDPEEWTDIINGAFEYMIKPVYGYEGIVARLMGDAILAFFGAPIAHEDDAQRAVLAGLEIVAGIAAFREQVRATWGLELNVRVGINTGLVVVGAVGSDLRMEYTAMGDAINLASRMESTAAPGTVQIAEDTYNLVAPLFEFEKLGGIAVRGKADTVNAFRVLGQKNDSSYLRGSHGLNEQLIGRAEEQQLLGEALAQLVEGYGRILCLSGEAGLGKSRLISELQRTFVDMSPGGDGGEPANFRRLPRWFRTSSMSYESVRPYGLFQNFIRQVCGITINDSPERVRQTINTFGETVAPAQQSEVQQVLASLLSVERTDGGHPALEGEAFKQKLFEVILQLVGDWAAEAPAVLVCDDIHWSDTASIELLTHLFQLTESRPLLFICAMRPDHEAPAWEAKRQAEQDFAHRFTDVLLSPLKPEDSRKLIMSLLSTSELPDGIVDQVIERTAGNPFFIEEVVHTLIESGHLLPDESGAGWRAAQSMDARQLQVPDSLQSLLAARIDRLDEAHRHTLQLAAMVGQSFPFRTLELIWRFEGHGAPGEAALVRRELERQLLELQRVGLIRQAARTPELIYTFRNLLIQETVYRTMLRKQRRAYHQKIGEALESSFGGTTEEHSLELAHHFSESGDHSRVLRYGMLAGDNAFRLYANTEAVAHYEVALRAARRVTANGEELAHLYTHYGRALELSGQIEEALAAYEEMLAVAERRNDQSLQLAALIAAATLRSTPTSVYAFEAGEALLARALQLAEAIHDGAAEAKIAWSMLNLYRFSGRTNQAVVFGERALAAARKLDLHEQIAFAANDLAHAYNRLGRYEQSRTTLREANVLWRELGNQPMLADNLATSSYVHVYTGDYDAALAFADEAYQISDAIANRWGKSYSHWQVGRVYWDRGQPGRATEVMEASVRSAEEAGFVVALVYTRVDLALVYGELGAAERAVDLARMALTVAEETMSQLLPYALARTAQLYLMLGEPDEAAKLLERWRADPGPWHMVQPNVIPLSECELALACGELEVALQRLNTRLADLHRYGMRADVPETCLLLATAYQARGDAARASGCLAQARNAAESLQAPRVLWRILLAQAEVESDPAQASTLRAEAASLVQAIAAQAGAPDLRETFLTSRHVRSLLQ